jgi:type IV pilus assembly protein PilW
MATLNIGRRAPKASRGLTLIDILVGLVIGLIGIVVVFQVLAVSEDRKRTTVQGTDAQSSGAIGLYSLTRDVQLGGYGFATGDTKQLGCLVKAHDRGDPLAVPPIPAKGDFTFRLYPVEIVQGAAGAPDTIRVLWGNSNQFVTSRDWKLDLADATTPRSMTGGRGGLDYGDLVVLTSDPASAPPPAPAVIAPDKKTECALVQVTDRPTAKAQKIGHNLAYTLNPAEILPPAATNPLPRFNRPAGVDFGNYAGGFALNLGKQPRRTEWSINGTRLTVAETLFSLPTVEAADGIVNLQAEYGIDRNDNQQIDANEWTVTPPDNSILPADPNKPCLENPPKSWRCVRAVRVALLARSAHWDKNACSSNPQWTAGAGGALVRTDFVMTNVDGSADAFVDCSGTPDPNNWRLYRYSVYETVIPLRNMIWGTAP